MLCACHRSYSMRTGEFKASLSNSIHSRKRTRGAAQWAEQVCAEERETKVAALMAWQLRAQAALTKDPRQADHDHLLL